MRIRGILLGWLLLGLLPLISSAQQRSSAGADEALVREVMHALRTASVDVLLRRVQGNVEVQLIDRHALYSATQARHVLRTFFEDNPPARIRLEKSVRRRQHLFLTGLLQTRNRREFRLYMHYQRTRNGWILREIRILSHS